MFRAESLVDSGTHFWHDYLDNDTDQLLGLKDSWVQRKAIRPFESTVLIEATSASCPWLPSLL